MLERRRSGRVTCSKEGVVKSHVGKKVLRSSHTFEIRWSDRVACSREEVQVESHVRKKRVRSSYIFESRGISVRWPVVCGLSVSRPRLRRLLRARKPTASKNNWLITKAGCHLVGVGQCSPRAGLRSTLKLRRSSGSCRSQYLQ